jgi:hypothetical protein
VPRQGEHIIHDKTEGLSQIRIVIPMTQGFSSGELCETLKKLQEWADIRKARGAVLQGRDGSGENWRSCMVLHLFHNTDRDCKLRW